MEKSGKRSGRRAVRPYRLFVCLNKITYRTVICPFLFSRKKTRRHFTISSVILKAFTAFALPWTGLVCAITILFILINITFHSLHLPLFNAFNKINGHENNNQG